MYDITMDVFNLLQKCLQVSAKNHDLQFPQTPQTPTPNESSLRFSLAS